MPSIERLFNTFEPANYRIKLDLNFEELKLNGFCSITGQIKNNKPIIQLHAKDLTIDSILMDGTKLKFTQHDDILSITIPEDVKHIKIDISYTAEITKAMHGIYPSKSTDGKTLVSTQFESHHAREAFPCVDEPEAKATFDLTIIGPKNNTYLSNMPIKEQTEEQASITTAFDTTPIMSTYLLAFVAGPLQSISQRTKDGVDVSIWSTPDHNIKSLDFALEVTVRTIEFLNDYFDVPYPLPKMDQVAIPDFSSGAMENWGLVTYREIALLADPEKVSASSKEMVALVIAHELSHQWFGNLVTMKWWDDLWLNESFATLMEYLVIDNLYPKWNVMLSFAAHEALSAYRRDILPGVQPVSTPVNHPDEISTLFDPSIVYAKGARLLWMVFNIVGESAFRKGLKAYFKAHAYSNTVGDDLWQALSQSSGIDISSIMHKWITQPGLPFITIKEIEPKLLTITQNRLTSNGPTNDITWPIPLWADDDSELVILDNKSENIKTSTQHTRFNVIGGHYACNYDSKSTRHHIRNNIEKKLIPADGRLLVLSDAILLSRCGVAPIHQMLDSISAYKKEDQEAVWSMISLALSDVKMLIEGDEQSETLLKKYVYSLIKDKYLDLGWDHKPSESSNDTKLRSIITNLAVYSESQDVINKALDIFKKNGIDKLNSDSRPAILSTVAKHGDSEEFNNLMRAYTKETIADIKIDISGAICSTKNTDNIKLIISKLKNEDFVRLQDLDRFVIYMLRNSASRALIWQWIIDNWQWISENFASDKSYDNYPRYAASAFSTEDWLSNYKKHFMPLHDIPALTRNVDVGISDIENKIKWRKIEEADLKSWLKSQ